MVREILAELPIKDRFAGLKPEDRFAGLKPEDRYRRAYAREIQALLKNIHLKVKSNL